MIFNSSWPLEPASPYPALKWSWFYQSVWSRIGTPVFFKTHSIMYPRLTITALKEQGCFYRIKCEVKWKLLSHVWLFATSRPVACQAPLSMELSRQQYWSGLPCPSLGDLPNPGIEPRSPTLQADSLPSEPPGKPWWEGDRYVKTQVKKVSVAHSCLNLWDPMDCNLPGSSVHGTLQTRKLE